MRPNYVDIITKGLVLQGYIEKGGSDVFRLLINPTTGQHIKVFYTDYELKEEVMVRES
jgi:hypothetical protein